MLGSLNWCLGTVPKPCVPVVLSRSTDSHTLFRPTFGWCLVVVLLTGRSRVESFSVFRSKISFPRRRSTVFWLFDLRCDPVSINKLSIESFERIHLRLPNPLGSPLLYSCRLGSLQSILAVLGDCRSIDPFFFNSSLVNKPFPIASRCNPSVHSHGA